MGSAFRKPQSGFRITSGQDHDFGKKKLSLSAGGQFCRAKYSIKYKQHKRPLPMNNPSHRNKLKAFGYRCP